MHTAQLFSISNITPIEETYKLESVIFIKKYLNNKLPIIFEDFLGSKDAFLNNDPRTKYRVKIPKDYKKGQLFYSILSTWNEVDEQLRIPSKAAAAKSRLKKLTKERLDKFQCPTKNCYSCRQDKFRDYKKYTQY